MMRPQPTEEMSSRKRFKETMRYGEPDRIPYFEEGIRQNVLDAWRAQGLAKDADISRMFPSDRRERIELNLNPLPKLITRFTRITDLKKFRRRLNLFGKIGGSRKWSKNKRAWQSCDHVLMLYVHRGFFLTMGVHNWRKFNESMYLLMDRPDLVRERMMIQSEFSARRIERILKEVNIDAAVFSEPIGGNDRPIISPKIFEEIVLKSYEPVLDVLHRFDVKIIIFQTYANARILIPSILRWGFNCLWACEVNIEAMDYRSLRKEFGRDLRLIGGIDLDALRQNKAAIRREIEEKVPPLIADGGYVPLADGRVREDVPFENYVYYRRLLEKITQVNIEKGQDSF